MANEQEKLKELLQKGFFTQKEIAKRLNVSTSTISQYLGDKYSGDVNLINEKVAKLLKTTEAKTQNDVKRIQLNFVQTSVATRIFNIIKMCQLNGEIGVCFGRSGYGKTTACKRFAAQNYGVIFIDPSENASKKEVIKQLASELGIDTSDLTFRIEAMIVDKLINRDYVLIIDEAENLKSSVFRTLRKIHDRCNGTLGLLFVGTERLYYNLCRMKGEFEYLTNRIACVEALDCLQKKDVKALVEQIFPNVEDNIINAFKVAAHNNARELFNVLKRTSDFVNSGHLLSPQTIAATKQCFIGGLAV